MMQIYGFYATNFEERRAQSGNTGSSMTTAVVKHGGMSHCSSFSHRMLMSYENCREMLSDFAVLPNVVDAQVCFLFIEMVLLFGLFVHALLCAVHVVVLLNFN